LPDFFANTKKGRLILRQPLFHQVQTQFPPNANFADTMV
jgi:hypothetical protein